MPLIAMPLTIAFHLANRRRMFFPLRGRAVLLCFLPLAACAGGAQRPAPAPPPPLPVAGLERVMGKYAGALFALFGEPGLDVREGPARKLQFAGAVCVLDTYLYPPAPGGVPVVSYVEARTPQGADFDGASCVAALARRPEAR